MTLYELLPLVDRMRDVEAGDPLRELLHVVEEQADVVRQDIDRLYDNWFIETCDDWVVPYIADLVGWTPVPEAGSFVSRRDVANTIRHRRRKGAVSLLPALAMDVGGWPGKAVEFFRLLAFNQHVGHLRTERGRVGTATTVDVRGRGLLDVGLFVWRLGSYPVTRTPAGVVERAGRSAFTFDAVGFDVPLFTASPEVPRPIARAEFEDEAGGVSRALYGEGKALAVWAPDWPAQGEGRPLPADVVVPADLGDWDAYRPKPGTVAVDPVRGRLLFPRRNPPERVYVSYHYGFSAPMGGGEYDRRVPSPGAEWLRRVEDSKGLRRALQDWADQRPAAAVIEFTDSDVYTARVDLTVRAGQSLTLRAANGVRPVLWVADRRSDRPDVVRAAVADGGELVLDGVVVAGHPVRIEGHEKEGEGADCVSPPRVFIRHCTLVPGWLPKFGCEPEAPPPPALEVVDLYGGRVEITHSIVGTVQVTAGRHDGEPVRLSVADSILDGTRPDLEAVGRAGPGAAYAVVRIVRTTVFGIVHVHAMELGENSIFDGMVKVARRGVGCVRFSSLVEGSRTPRRFHCVTEPPPRFTSRCYGDPGYAQLSCTCPDEIVRGADDRSEMGAFHDLFNPQRLAALTLRADEYTPAGLRVRVVPVT